MPGFTTHYLLGVKVFSDMPNNPLKRIISKYRWLYQLGLQGPDMFFYNIPILRHRDYRNVGSYMHENHVHDFFVTCLSHLSQIESRQQREQAIAYMSGFFCHYIGDSICHPYVYGRIEYEVKNATNYHHGLHAMLENDIDALLLMKYKKKKPSQFNQAATICLNGQEMQFISKFLSGCINETYYPLNYRNNYQVTSRMVHRSILAMRLGCRTLADPSSRKKNSIEFVESLFLRTPIASKKLVTDAPPDAVVTMNLNHETWSNPWNRRLASNASFPELFHLTMMKCGDAFYLLNEELSSPIPLKNLDHNRLLKELGNYSYHSGLAVDQD
ncbi:zinc dependent phospholipase C family protein [Lacrimispora algidixylanolytica]|uniref:Phospholipase n=1 Tax=Lacrimispora algidixylanolytica TaxID=94868 RepID=A0A419T385_9FIRM|nr:zinc dependent phospholipase C family protein [Lacrimispora algidixylanolytica]RKD32007.1 phospholipase [Lacrimispora algidixylanolytica]